VSETVHIKELGDKVAAEIFTTLGWKRTGPTDYRWTCVEQEKHGKKRRLVHPSDVVFNYHDPYYGRTVYVNTDLKSYAADSTAAYDPKKDLLSLVSAVECANKSGTFREQYIYDGEPWVVEGMLFVYNHDGEYDENFGTKLDKAPLRTRMPGKERVFVVGPQRILQLYSVCRDIDSRIQKLSRGGDFDSSGFVAPDLDVTKVKGKKVGAATLEMITGPWLLHQIRPKGGAKLIQVYYMDAEPSVNDFKYLIDALLDFQLLGDAGEITICVLNSKAENAAAFSAARNEYAAENHGITDEALDVFRARLERIKYASVATVIPPFFELELALTNG
jgi:hypothetical protein